MPDPTNLYEALTARAHADRDKRRAAQAAELRDWKPDPELEALTERVNARRAAGETVALGPLDVRLAAYRNRKAAAATFAEHGVLPDGSTPPETAA